jgi:hypothetical protein
MPETTTAERIDFWNLIARERGMPEGWMWFRLEVVDHRLPRDEAANSVTGAVCLARLKSGPRKGELNWTKRDPSTERTLIITFKEMDARERRWEQDEEKCCRCFGTGKDHWGQCGRCGGAGRPRISKKD